MKTHLAKIKYGINAGHQKRDSAPFYCLSLRAIEVVTLNGGFCVKSEQALCVWISVFRGRKKVFMHFVSFALRQPVVIMYKLTSNASCTIPPLRQKKSSSRGTTAYPFYPFRYFHKISPPMCLVCV